MAALWIRKLYKLPILTVFKLLKDVQELYCYTMTYFKSQSPELSPEQIGNHFSYHSQRNILEGLL